MSESRGSSGSECKPTREQALQEHNRCRDPSGRVQKGIRLCLGTRPKWPGSRGDPALPRHATQVAGFKRGSGSASARDPSGRWPGSRGDPALTLGQSHQSERGAHAEIMCRVSARTYASGADVAAEAGVAMAGRFHMGCAAWAA
eukprot:365253-Chlamydomonas_euryale.AAC.5